MKKQLLIVIRALPVLLLFGLVSCSDPIKPVMPVWNVGLNVPFSVEQYSMTDILGQNPMVRITPTSDSTFEAIIEDGVFIDTIKMNLDEKTIDKLRAVNEGVLVFEVVNNSPASAVVDMQFTDENYSPIYIPQQLSGQAFEIRAAEVAGDGSLISPVKSIFEVSVSTADIEGLLKSNWLILTMQIRTPGTLPIQFTYSNFLKMMIYAHIDIMTEQGDNP